MLSAPNNVYKSSRDPNFLMAASVARNSLKEAVAYCDYLLKKCQKDAIFEGCLYVAVDPAYERDVASSYIEEIDTDTYELKCPERSLPNQRFDARVSITRIYSWALAWQRGEGLRDRTYGSSGGAPSLNWESAFPRPSTIAEVRVPTDLSQGMKPFEDDQS